MNKEEILYKVEDVIVDLLAIDRALIKPETKLFEDLQSHLQLYIIFPLYPLFFLFKI